MKKLTVTIGIPAFNEEKNIVNLLKSIAKQKGNLFIIKKIIILCDNCTDKTADKAFEFAKNYKNIHIILDNERKGKVARLNQLYTLNKSDVLITFDADIVLS